MGINFKFKIGEIVKHKIINGKLIILEGQYRQYANGYEVTYNCRSDEKGEYGYYETHYHEHELGRIE